MGTHTLTVELQLTEAEESRLRDALRVEEGVDLAGQLGKLARASLQEWVDQILALRLPPRIKDARELRLLLYALHANDKRLPRPEQIADLFHLTPAEARTLYRNTSTRYSFEFAETIVEALGVALETGTWAESTDLGGYVRVHMDDTLFGFVELQLSSGTDESVRRLSKDVNYHDYRVPLSSLAVLCKKAKKDYELVIAAAKNKGET
jgi:hypothetical protein